MTVFRTRPLPKGQLRGQYLIASDLVDKTHQALSLFREAGRADGGHEGICFWAGCESANSVSLSAVIVPAADHGPLGVFVSASDFADATEKAHAMGLGILAQVHSHPGWDTRHSDGDDDLIIMPFEGMLSLVAPFYGRTVRSICDFSIHQFQDHRWILCSKKSVLANFRLADDKP